MVNLIINNKKIIAEEGTTILEAAKKNNILIPTLCYLEGVNQIGSCRICVVEVEGTANLQASCITPVREGMKVLTNSKKVRNARKVLYELMLSDHPKECLQCSRNQNCEFQKLGELIQIDESRFEGEKSKCSVDISSPAILRDTSKCILCRRCVAVCNEVQGVGILNSQFRGFESAVSPGEDLPLGSSSCTYCGQCTAVCPVDALKEKDSAKIVWDALQDPSKTVIVQTAPAVRAALGEEFGCEAGQCVTGKMVSALKEMNFDYVFDTNFAADLTIMEEGYELLQRLTQFLYSKNIINEDQNKKTGFKPSNKAVIPLITSCSPGWVNYIEHYYPEQIPNLSSCKSPHMMLGALCKSYFADKIKVNPKKMFMVSVMPCTAKKYEITRPEMQNNGIPDVDAVITTRELAKMIKDSGIDFNTLPDSRFDNPLGFSSGAADIFGASGGVMEAALRTVYEIVTGKELPCSNLHVEAVHGLNRIKTAEIKIEGAKEEWEFLNNITLKIAAASGLKGASILLDEIKKGESPYHFIEVMACPGGCISGGGQPRPVNDEIREKRMEVLYNEDEGKIFRKSHKNPFIIKLYQQYLEKPLSGKSHKLLHTVYTKKNKY